MRNKHWRLLAVLVLAALAGCGGKKDAESDSEGAGGKAWQKPFDAALVPPDCFAAFIVHPQRIAQSPALAGSAEMAELEKSPEFKEVVKNIGFDPRELEQAAMLITVPSKDAGARAEPGAVAVLRWAKPVDGKALFQKWNEGSDVRESKHAEKTYYTRVPKHEALRKLGGRESCYLPDDRTMVICPFEKQLQAVLESAGKKGPMSAHLAGLSLDRDAVAAFVAEPAKELIAPVAAEIARNAPPGMSEIGKAPGYVKAATLHVNLSEADLLKLTVEGTDAKAAESLHNIATALLGMLKTMYPDAREQLDKAPGMPADAKKTLLDLADQVVAGLSVAKSGERIDVSLRMKESATVARMLPLFSTWMSDARKSANESVRMMRLHQLSMATFNHEAAKGRLPAIALRDAGGKPLLSWRVQLLPYLDGGEIYKEFKLDEPWDSDHNKKLIAKMPQVFGGGPKDGLPAGHTTVLAFAGEWTPLGGKTTVGFAGIKDGAGNTIMLVDAGPDKAVPWTKPEDAAFEPANPIAALGQISDRGFVVVMCDGAVRRLPKNIPAATLKALITADGGETADWSVLRDEE